MTGKGFQNDRVVGSHLVESVPIHCKIAESFRSYLAVDECSLWLLQYSGGNRSFHFRPVRIRALEVQINAVGRRDAEVVVRVVDSWNYGAAAKVELFRKWTDEGLDFRRVSGSRDALAADRDSLHIG